IEEAVFTIQGILVAKELLPLQEKPKLSAQRYRFLQQRIVLTGLGSPTFTRAFEVAVEIYGYFDRQFSEGILESWMASQDSELDPMPCFDISNRYLTPTKETKDPDIPFEKGVDPWGILRGMASGNGTCTYVHTEDNQVQYFTTSREASGNRKFQPCKPQTFRIGDIVQAQLSFVVIPIKGGQCKMLSVLRSLALLDRNFGQV
ncbi:hypothetical protein L208DRAFT_1156497, partial [Tricholoma matsutake]